MVLITVSPRCQEQPMAPSSDVESTGTDEPLAEETLVEEVSIDGMCGVY